jgi:hypothetical protein
MAVEARWLDEVKAADQRLQSLEEETKTARAEYERAVRRLHVEGSSLREIAEALGLSHQRVHQIIGVRPKAWWTFWRGEDAIEQPGACSFCGARADVAEKLVAGPGIYICNVCVEGARAALNGATACGFVSLPAMSRKRCSFCGRRGSDHPRAMASDHQICRSCVDFAARMIAEAR